MDRLLRNLDALRRRDPLFEQAVENVRADVAAPSNPHGNLRSELVASMEAVCLDNQDVEEVVETHCSTGRPDLHRSCPRPERVRRVMARSDFVSYHVLDGAADLAEVEAWDLVLVPGSHKLDGGDLGGRTGRAGQPCWWTFGEDGRHQPEDGRVYVAELVLGEATCRRAAKEGVVVEVNLDGELASSRYFKPTSLEGFGSQTPFRPELTGADHGHTVPAEEGLRGWPEVVSLSADYVDVLDDDTEVDVRVLAY